jgi:tetratricopeptide (TPR) repeat protein
LADLCLELGEFGEAARLYSAARSSGHRLGENVIVSHAWALAKAGRPDEALVVCQEYVEQNEESGWRHTIEDVASTIREDGDEPLTAQAALRRLYGPHFGKGQSPRVQAAVFVADAIRDADALRDRALLVDAMAGVLFRIGDEAGERAWQEKLLREFPSERDLCAGVYMSRAGRRYGTGDKAAALAAYRHVATEYRDTSHCAVAQFNMGQILQEAGEYRDAIPEFSRLIESDVDDLDSSPFIMQTYRNYRPRAQWEIGNCYFGLGDYAAAYDAYRSTHHEHPFRSWCGTCSEGDQRRYALYEGLCLEYLLRHEEAVRTYWGVMGCSVLGSSVPVNRRLVDLYSACGQVDDLVGILDFVDNRFRACLEAAASEMRRSYAAAGKDLPADSDEWVDRAAEEGPAHLMRTILRIRALGAAEEWRELLPFLDPGGGAPDEYWGRRSYWTAVEASRCLARKPEETVALLSDALRARQTADARWVWYALGLCGTPDAVSALREVAARTSNVHRAATLAYCLQLAGREGEAAIEDLEASGGETAVARAYRRGGLGESDQEIPFPAIPEGLTLPSEPADLLPADLFAE